MLKDRRTLFVVFTMLCAVLLLAACTRQAITETLPTAPPEGVGGGGEGEQADVAATETAIANMQAILFAGQTQTAEAVLSGTGGGDVATPTPTAPAVVAPTATPPPPPTATAAGPKQYTVKPGDWLHKIARENGVSPEALIAANPNINPDSVLKPGTVLNIPAAGSPAPGGATTGEKTYVVKSGDNLFRIALNNDTTLETLAQLNGISAPYTVYPGQVLKLP